MCWPGRLQARLKITGSGFEPNPGQFVVLSRCHSKGRRDSAAFAMTSANG